MNNETAQLKLAHDLGWSNFFALGFSRNPYDPNSLNELERARAEMYSLGFIQAAEYDGQLKKMGYG